MVLERSDFTSQGRDTATQVPQNNKMHLTRGGLSALFLLALAGCGVCEEGDVERVAAPDGKTVARKFVVNCGATTGFVTVVEVETSMPRFLSANELFSAEGLYDIRLRWAAPDELVMECSRCPELRPDAPRVNGVRLSMIRP